MQLIVDEAHLGTTEQAWRRCPRLAACGPASFGPPSRVVVLAPHPDDEVLGVGGILHGLAETGFQVEVVAVTDGEASHPNASITPEELSSRRHVERGVALARLGLGAAPVRRLGIPDGRVAREHLLVARITDSLEGASLCFAPWDRDGHPDHDATGRAAVAACRALGVRLLQYPIWAWHWAKPDSTDLPWHRARRIELDDATRAHKRSAIRAYHSQIHALGPNPGEEAVLPVNVLARFQRSFEIVFA